jgi:hypothetical protein
VDACVCRQYQTGDLTHTMLAFEFGGGWNDLQGSVAVTVLQFLLGGGGSFSAGGPGECMTLPSRILPICVGRAPNYGECEMTFSFIHELNRTLALFHLMRSPDIRGSIVCSTSDFPPRNWRSVCIVPQALLGNP